MRRPGGGGGRRGYRLKEGKGSGGEEEGGGIDSMKCAASVVGTKGIRELYTLWPEVSC